jgi:hypothetical protein
MGRNRIMCPDFITSGYYTVGDVIEYFEAIREKWRSKQDEERRRRVTKLLEKINRMYNEGKIGKETYIIVNPKIVEEYELRK